MNNPAIRCVICNPDSEMLQMVGVLPANSYLCSHHLQLGEDERTRRIRKNKELRLKRARRKLGFN